MQNIVQWMSPNSIKLISTILSSGVVIFFILTVAGKLSANSMDEKRKEHVAYEYLCHLEEAKQ